MHRSLVISSGALVRGAAPGVKMVSFCTGEPKYFGRKMLQWTLCCELHRCRVADVCECGPVVTRPLDGKGPTGTPHIQTAVTISPHVAQTSKPLTNTSSRKLWIPLDAEAHSLFGLWGLLLLPEHLCNRRG